MHNDDNKAQEPPEGYTQIDSYTDHTHKSSYKGTFTPPDNNPPFNEAVSLRFIHEKDTPLRVKLLVRGRTAGMTTTYSESDMIPEDDDGQLHLKARAEGAETVFWQALSYPYKAPEGPLSISDRAQHELLGYWIVHLLHNPNAVLHDVEAYRADYINTINYVTNDND